MPKKPINEITGFSDLAPEHRGEAAKRQEGAKKEQMKGNARRAEKASEIDEFHTLDPVEKRRKLDAVKTGKTEKKESGNVVFHSGEIWKDKTPDWILNGGGSDEDFSGEQFAKPINPFLYNRKTKEMVVGQHEWTHGWTAKVEELDLEYDEYVDLVSAEGWIEGRYARDKNTGDQVISFWNVVPTPKLEEFKDIFKKLKFVKGKNDSGKFIVYTPEPIAGGEGIQIQESTNLRVKKIKKSVDLTEAYNIDSLASMMESKIDEALNVKDASDPGKVLITKRDAKKSKMVGDSEVGALGQQVTQFHLLDPVEKKRVLEKLRSVAVNSKKKRGDIDFISGSDWFNYHPDVLLNNDDGEFKSPVKPFMYDTVNNKLYEGEHDKMHDDGVLEDSGADMVDDDYFDKWLVGRYAPLSNGLGWIVTFWNTDPIPQDAMDGVLTALTIPEVEEVEVYTTKPVSGGVENVAEAIVPDRSHPDAKKMVQTKADAGPAQRKALSGRAERIAKREGGKPFHLLSPQEKKAELERISGEEKRDQLGNIEVKIGGRDFGELNPDEVWSMVDDAIPFFYFSKAGEIVSGKEDQVHGVVSENNFGSNMDKLESLLTPEHLDAAKKEARYSPLSSKGEAEFIIDHLDREKSSLDRFGFVAARIAHVPSEDKIILSFWSFVDREDLAKIIKEVKRKNIFPAGEIELVVMPNAISDMNESINLSDVAPKHRGTAADRIVSGSKSKKSGDEARAEKIAKLEKSGKLDKPFHLLSPQEKAEKLKAMSGEGETTNRGGLEMIKGGKDFETFNPDLYFETKDATPFIYIKSSGRLIRGHEDDFHSLMMRKVFPTSKGKELIKVAKEAIAGADKGDDDIKNLIHMVEKYQEAIDEDNQRKISWRHVDVSEFFAMDGGRGSKTLERLGFVNGRYGFNVSEWMIPRDVTAKKKKELMKDKTGTVSLWSEIPDGEINNIISALNKSGRVKEPIKRFSMPAGSSGSSNASNTSTDELVDDLINDLESVDEETGDLNEVVNLDAQIAQIRDSYPKGSPEAQEKIQALRDRHEKDTEFQRIGNARKAAIKKSIMDSKKKHGGLLGAIGANEADFHLLDPVTRDRLLRQAIGNEKTKEDKISDRLMISTGVAYINNSPDKLLDQPTAMPFFYDTKDPAQKGKVINDPAVRNGASMPPMFDPNGEPTPRKFVFHQNLADSMGKEIPTAWKRGRIAKVGKRFKIAMYDNFTQEIVEDIVKQLDDEIQGAQVLFYLPRLLDPETDRSPIMVSRENKDEFAAGDAGTSPDSLWKQGGKHVGFFVMADGSIIGQERDPKVPRNPTHLSILRDKYIDDPEAFQSEVLNKLTGIPNLDETARVYKDGDENKRGNILNILRNFSREEDSLSKFGIVSGRYNDGVFSLWSDVGDKGLKRIIQKFEKQFGKEVNKAFLPNHGAGGKKSMIMEAIVPDRSNPNVKKMVQAKADAGPSQREALGKRASKAAKLFSGVDAKKLKNGLHNAPQEIKDQIKKALNSGKEEKVKRGSLEIVRGGSGWWQHDPDVYWGAASAHTFWYMVPKHGGEKRFLVDDGSETHLDIVDDFFGSDEDVLEHMAQHYGTDDISELEYKIGAEPDTYESLGQLWAIGTRDGDTFADYGFVAGRYVFKDDLITLWSNVSDKVVDEIIDEIEKEHPTTQFEIKKVVMPSG